MKTESFIQYLRYEKNYSSHTVFAYKTDLDQFFGYARSEFGVDTEGEVDGDMVRAWMVSLMEAGLSARSVARKLTALKSYWRYLLREGEVRTSPLNGLKAPKQRKPLPAFLKEKELDELLDAGEDGRDTSAFVQARDRLILEMFADTGMRRAELIGLGLADVDLDAARLRVLGKRNKQRLIPFGRELETRIREYLAARRELASSIGDVYPVSDRLFIRENGQALYPQLVYRLVRDRISAVGSLTKNSPHVLRHSFATAMLNGGAELNAVKELLGHAGLSATEVYTHTTFEELKKVYKQAHPRG